jgi:hypothetical protein
LVWSLSVLRVAIAKSENVDVPNTKQRGRSKQTRQQQARSMGGGVCPGGPPPPRPHTPPWGGVGGCWAGLISSSRGPPRGPEEGGESADLFDTGEGRGGGIENFAFRVGAKGARIRDLRG